jgi:hypothetical protein
MKRTGEGFKLHTNPELYPRWVTEEGRYVGCCKGYATPLTKFEYKYIIRDRKGVGLHWIKLF